MEEQKEVQTQNVQEQAKTGNSNQLTDTSVDYISAINEIKQNSVSKDEYQKLRNENKKLIESIVNGTASEAKPEPKIDKKQLRDELYGNDRKQLNNLEYIDKVLKLRKAIMEDGGIDPFVPNGEKIKPTKDDFEKAQNVAEVLQECVDYAAGNSDVFTDQLTRNIR